MDYGVWWRYVILWSGIFSFTIFTFAHGRGVISKILKNQIVSFIAAVSLYAFLIHNVVIRYINALLGMLINENFINNYGHLINLFLGLPITIVLSWFWNYIVKNRQNKRNNTNEYHGVNHEYK